MKPALPSKGYVHKPFSPYHPKKNKPYKPQYKYIHKPENKSELPQIDTVPNAIEYILVNLSLAIL